MSFQFYQLAKETGVLITPDANLIQIFDLIDNMHSYSEWYNDQQESNS